MQKNFSLLVEYGRIKFTAVDTKIADYLLNVQSPSHNIEKLAQTVGVSPASITRFSKKLGFNNFKELLYVQGQDESSPLDVSNLHHTYIDILTGFHSSIDKEQILRFSEEISDHDIIHVFGLGYSALAAEDLKFRFTRLGKYLEVVKDIDSMKMISSILSVGSLVIVLSLNGLDSRILACVKEMKSKGITVMVITANRKSKLLLEADSYLVTSNLQGEDLTGIISGQLPILMAIDHIYLQYVSDHSTTIKNWSMTECVLKE